MNTISNSDDVIDSRDVIARIEELTSDLQSTHEQEMEDGETNLDFEEWLKTIITSSNAAHAHESFDDVMELNGLTRLQDQAECSPDWIHGESLINEDYFTKYIEELINDCYEMPKDFDSGNWPWRHMKLDYEAAADEAKVDYMEVDFDGNTFLIRA